MTQQREHFDPQCLQRKESTQFPLPVTEKGLEAESIGYQKWQRREGRNGQLNTEEWLKRQIFLVEMNLFHLSVNRVFKSCGIF